MANATPAGAPTLKPTDPKAADAAKDTKPTDPKAAEKPVNPYKVKGGAKLSDGKQTRIDY